MIYSVRFSHQAAQEIAQAPAHMRPRINKQALALVIDPRPPKAKELEAPWEGLWRIWVDKWRLVYRIDDDEQEVLIVRVLLKTGPETYELLE